MIRIDFYGSILYNDMEILYFIELSQTASAAA